MVQRLVGYNSPVAPRLFVIASSLSLFLCVSLAISGSIYRPGPFQGIHVGVGDLGVTVGDGIIILQRGIRLARLPRPSRSCRRSGAGGPGDASNGENTAAASRVGTISGPRREGVPSAGC